jgi:hypothetical protein
MSIGIVYLLCLATHIYPEHANRFLLAVKKACDCIWERGLLTKGVGLCHGIAGNAYCFLIYARTLKQVRSRSGDNISTPHRTVPTDVENKPHHIIDISVRRAHTFAQFIIEHFDELRDIPDKPYSLYGGENGDV